MNKKVFFIMMIVVLFFAICGILYNIFFAKNEIISDPASLMQDKETSTSDIVEISIDTVNGITMREAEELCYYVLGEKDEDTGFTFSFGTSGAVEKDKKQYYVIRASWLVNKSHLSYIGDFFVSSDGKEIYSGTASPGEYIMVNRIWGE